MPAAPSTASTSIAAGLTDQTDSLPRRAIRLCCSAATSALREHGYSCTHGFLHYRGSRTRVEIPFTDELERTTLESIALARAAARATDLPPPLDDSPKCNGCSLNGICLPDETLALAAGAPAEGALEPRRLYPVRDEAMPLYIQEQGVTVGKNGASLVVRNHDGELGRFRLIDVSQLVICGNIQVTTQTLHLLCESGIPVVHMSRGYWFYGVTHGMNLRNAYDRAAQFAVASDPARCLHFAKQVVLAKVQNQRTLLRRNAVDLPERVLEEFGQVLRDIDLVGAPNQLLGCEGNGAAIYFRHFGRMLKPRDLSTEWDFANRNRRPPRDPINAMLSFAYALLAKELTVAILGTRETSQRAAGNSRAVSAEHALEHLFAVETMMLGHLSEDRCQGPHPELFVVRDREVMSTVPLRGEPQVAAHLPGDLVSKNPQGLRQFPPREIPGQLHAAMISSRTMCSRMNLGISSGSKWHRTASRTASRSCGRSSASVTTDTPTARAV